MPHKKNDKYPLLSQHSGKNMEFGDELNLVDLWILLRRYKRHFVWAFSISLLAAFMYVFFVYVEKVELVTTIQIGTREKDNTILPIESPESLLSKINNSIIPSYTYEWAKKNNFAPVIETVAINPGNTNIILIKNKTSEENIGLLSDFQKGLISIVKDDHKRIINTLKSHVQSELTMAQLELDKLKSPLTLEHKLKIGQMKLDEAKIKLEKLEDEQYLGIKKAEFQNDILLEQHEQKRLQDSEESYKKQILRIEETKKILLENMKELKRQITEATNNRRIAAASATEQSAMAQLLISNEIQQNQNRLATLEERYYVLLENEKSALAQKIEDFRLQTIMSEKRLDLLNEKYNRMLVDNQFDREQQKLALDEVNLELQQIKLKHESSVSAAEEKVREVYTILDNFDETRIVSTAVPSLKPTGLSRVQLLFLSLFLAGFVGFFAMLFVLFRDQLKRRLEEVREQ